MLLRVKNSRKTYRLSSGQTSKGLMWRSLENVRRRKMWFPSCFPLSVLARGVGEAVVLAATSPGKFSCGLGKAPLQDKSRINVTWMVPGPWVVWCITYASQGPGTIPTTSDSLKSCGRGIKEFHAFRKKKMQFKTKYSYITFWFLLPEQLFS